MERRLALWFGLPFLALAGVFVAIDLIAPGLIRRDLFMVLILGLVVTGSALILVHAVIQIRSGESAFVALSSIAVILVVTGINFHREIYVVSLGLVVSASMDSFERGEGMRFAPADDGRYRPRAVVNGNVVDFVVDTGIADIVLTSEDARRMGIDPSTLSFDHEINTASGPEKAATIRLERLQFGSILMEDVPAIVTTGNVPGNVLGSSFFDRLSEWEIRDGQLMIVQ